MLCWSSNERRRKRRRRAYLRTGKVDGRVGKEEEEVQRLWGMVYADDTGIVSRSSEGLERMMTVIATACSAFGLTICEAQTEIMCLQTIDGGKVSFTINAAGQGYKQTVDFVYLGGAISVDRELSIDITRRLQRAWASFQRYKTEIYDRTGVRLLKAEMIETLLYGCMTWSLNKPDYDRLPQVHHSKLLRFLGWRKRKRDDHTLSYADVLAKAASESIDTTVRKRRIILRDWGRSVHHRG